MYHGYNVYEEVIPSECCQSESTWIDCAECNAQGYTECFALRCDDCGVISTDHKESE